MGQKEIYDRIYSAAEKDYWSEVRIELFKGRKFGKVLDIGCGDGYGSRVLEYADYTGVDISPKAGRYLKKFFVSDCKKLPFKDNAFDTILMFEVIEHLTATEQVLKELKRVLKDGGRIIITTPNSRNFFVWFYESVKKNSIVRKIFGRADIEGDQHEREYTIESLTKTLAKVGFKEVNVKDVGLGIGFLFSFLVYGRFSTPFSKKIIAIDYRLPAINGHNLFAEAM